ncbi:hypothetical protein BMF94_0511 [Rhodotorula taiwanensis]|uniref:SET domain-containing protein n=1 Tax=Rhodotorula taiwanensis TaxID=741276 RepID=A0A2S5BHR4_9BASI|nr:hypothetical protein BMF94_0511 [Rhodotorula taiwanensis]
MALTAPYGFPPGVQYLSTPVPSRLLSPQDRLTYCSPCPPSGLPNAPPKLSIRKISDPGHPANGQSGLFNVTGKPIPRGTWLRDYVGWVHTEDEADLRSDYDLSLDRRVIRDERGDVVRVDVIGIDATKMGAEARFVNDYRGVPGFVRPNAVFELREWDLPSSTKAEPKKGIRMAVWAGPHGIDKGAEICVSYGRGFWQKRSEEAAQV